LAERIGKDKGYIENRLALLNVPEDVQQMVEQRPDSVRAAREIAKLPTHEERRPLIEGVVAGSLTDRDIRAQVREARGGASQRSPSVLQPQHRTPEQESQPEELRSPPTQLSLDDDVRTMQALVRRWQRALEQGQISQMDLAMAIGAIDEALADVRALIQVEETVQ
jgi:ParB-like chromosome segregation protein Spo0J